MARYGRWGRAAGRIGSAVCAAVVLLAGCQGIQGGDSPAGGESEGAADGRVTGPLDNPDGTKPGLAPVTGEADRAEARELIETVSTKGRGPKTGYDRDEFGYAWMDSADGVPLARNGCDTRIISMVRAVVGLFSQRMQGVVACA